MTTLFSFFISQTSWAGLTLADRLMELPADPCQRFPAIGTVCLDGSVYAGTSPDGSVPMYATRCDYGQTWSGSSCTGTAGTETWNVGSGGGPTFVVTGINNANTGRSNTNSLANLVDGGTPYYAAKTCEDLVEGGHSDWYLPADAELHVLCTNRVAIGNFVTAGGVVYWSSTEATATGAEIESFTTCFLNSTQNKSTANTRHRCVRR